MLKTLKKNKLIILTFVLITLLFKPLWIFNNSSLGIPGDDMSYWLHSATLAFDQDLEYKMITILKVVFFMQKQMPRLIPQVQDI